MKKNRKIRILDLCSVVRDDRATGGHHYIIYKGIAWRFDIFFLNLSINMVESGILFALFCAVNWLDVELRNIDAGANK